MNTDEHYLTIPPIFRSHKGQLRYSDPFNDRYWLLCNLWKGYGHAERPDPHDLLDYCSNDTSYGVGFDCAEGDDAAIWKNWWVV